jgi:AhpD family alkylhydroperoxidase
MKQRINFFAKGQNAMKAMFGLGSYLGQCAIEQELLHLIYFRVSQINGCAYCLDMHSKDLLAIGENAQRLFLLDAWREAPLYSARECAALEWA